MKTNLIKKFKVSRKLKYNIFNDKRLNDVLVNVKFNNNQLLSYKSILIEKSKIRYIFGFYKKSQFNKFYNKYKKNRFNFIKLLFIVFHYKLDFLISKTCFCTSIMEAKQLINHKLVRVNNKVITSSLFIVKPGDVVSIKYNQIYTNKCDLDYFVTDIENSRILILNSNINLEYINIDKELLSFLK